MARTKGSDCALYLFNGIVGENGELIGTWNSNTEKINEKPALGRIFYRQDGDWSRGTLDTYKMYDDGEYAYIFFGAYHEVGIDYPEGFGVARASLKNADGTKKNPEELLSLAAWELYQYNPIMIRGSFGSRDEGAVWTLTPFEYNGTLYAFYEGCGTNTEHESNTQDEEATYSTSHSHNTRETAYWGYTFSSSSNIMVCTLNKNNLQNPVNWDKNSKLSLDRENIYLRAKSTDAYLSYDRNNNLTSGNKNTAKKFTLTFENQFFRIRGENECYVSPIMEINTYSENSYNSAYIYKHDSNIIVKYGTDNLFGSDLTTYSSLMGLDWELYPLVVDGETYYKIQNRWTGCFMNLNSDGTVGQSKETNDDSMLWKITKNIEN